MSQSGSLKPRDSGVGKSKFTTSNVSQAFKGSRPEGAKSIASKTPGGYEVIGKVTKEARVFPGSTAAAAAGPKLASDDLPTAAKVSSGWGGSGKETIAAPTSKAASSTELESTNRTQVGPAKTQDARAWVPAGATPGSKQLGFTQNDFPKLGELNEAPSASREKAPEQTPLDHSRLPPGDLVPPNEHPISFPAAGYMPPFPPAVAQGPVPLHMMPTFTGNMPSFPPGGFAGYPTFPPMMIRQPLPKDLHNYDMFRAYTPMTSPMFPPMIDGHHFSMPAFVDMSGKLQVEEEDDCPWTSGKLQVDYSARLKFEESDDESPAPSKDGCQEPTQSKSTVHVEPSTPHETGRTGSHDSNPEQGAAQDRMMTQWPVAAPYGFPGFPAGPYGYWYPCSHPAMFRMPVRPPVKLSSSEQDKASQRPDSEHVQARSAEAQSSSKPDTVPAAENTEQDTRVMSRTKADPPENDSIHHGRGARLHSGSAPPRGPRNEDSMSGHPVETAADNYPRKILKKEDSIRPEVAEPPRQSDNPQDSKHSEKRSRRDLGFNQSSRSTQKGGLSESTLAASQPSTAPSAVSPQVSHLGSSEVSRVALEKKPDMVNLPVPPVGDTVKSLRLQSSNPEVQKIERAVKGRDALGTPDVVQSLPGTDPAISSQPDSRSCPAARGDGSISHSEPRPSPVIEDKQPRVSQPLPNEVEDCSDTPPLRMSRSALSQVRKHLETGVRDTPRKDGSLPLSDVVQKTEDRNRRSQMDRGSSCVAAQGALDSSRGAATEHSVPVPSRRSLLDDYRPYSTSTYRDQGPYGSTRGRGDVGDSWPTGFSQSRPAGRQKAAEKSGFPRVDLSNLNDDCAEGSQPRRPNRVYYGGDDRGVASRTEDWASQRKLASGSGDVRKSFQTTTNQDHKVQTRKRDVKDSDRDRLQSNPPQLSQLGDGYPASTVADADVKRNAVPISTGGTGAGRHHLGGDSVETSSRQPRDSRKPQRNEGERVYHFHEAADRPRSNQHGTSHRGPSHLWRGGSRGGVPNEQSYHQDPLRGPREDRLHESSGFQTQGSNNHRDGMVGRGNSTSERRERHPNNEGWPSTQARGHRPSSDGFINQRSRNTALDGGDLPRENRPTPGESHGSVRHERAGSRHTRAPRYNREFGPGGDDGEVGEGDQCYQDRPRSGVVRWLRGAEQGNRHRLDKPPRDILQDQHPADPGKEPGNETPHEQHTRFKRAKKPVSGRARRNHGESFLGRRQQEGMGNQQNNTALTVSGTPSANPPAAITKGLEAEAGKLNSHQSHQKPSQLSKEDVQRLALNNYASVVVVDEINSGFTVDDAGEDGFVTVSTKRDRRKEKPGTHRSALREQPVRRAAALQTSQSAPKLASSSPVSKRTVQGSEGLPGQLVVPQAPATSSWDSPHSALKGLPTHLGATLSMSEVAGRESLAPSGPVQNAWCKPLRFSVSTAMVTATAAERAANLVETQPLAASVMFSKTVGNEKMSQKPEHASPSSVKMGASRGILVDASKAVPDRVSPPKHSPTDLTKTDVGNDSKALCGVDLLDQNPSIHHSRRSPRQHAGRQRPNPKLREDAPGDVRTVEGQVSSQRPNPNYRGDASEDNRAKEGFQLDHQRPNPSVCGDALRDTRTMEDGRGQRPNPSVHGETPRDKRTTEDGRGQRPNPNVCGEASRETRIIEDGRGQRPNPNVRGEAPRDTRTGEDGQVNRRRRRRDYDRGGPRQLGVTYHDNQHRNGDRVYNQNHMQDPRSAGPPSRSSRRPLALMPSCTQPDSRPELLRVPFRNSRKDDPMQGVHALSTQGIQKKEETADQTETALTVSQPASGFLPTSTDGMHGSTNNTPPTPAVTEINKILSAKKAWDEASGSTGQSWERAPVTGPSKAVGNTSPFSPKKLEEAKSPASGELPSKKMTPDQQNVCFVKPQQQQATAGISQPPAQLKNTVSQETPQVVSPPSQTQHTSTSAKELQPALWLNHSAGPSKATPQFPFQPMDRHLDTYQTFLASDGLTDYSAMQYVPTPLGASLSHPNPDLVHHQMFLNGMYAAPATMPATQMYTWPIGSTNHPQHYQFQAAGQRATFVGAECTMPPSVYLQVKSTLHGGNHALYGSPGYSLAPNGSVGHHQKGQQQQHVHGMLAFNHHQQHGYGGLSGYNPQFHHQTGPTYQDQMRFMDPTSLPVGHGGVTQVRQRQPNTLVGKSSNMGHNHPSHGGRMGGGTSSFGHVGPTSKVGPAIDVNSGGNFHAGVDANAGYPYSQSSMAASHVISRPPACTSTKSVGGGSTSSLRQGAADMTVRQPTDIGLMGGEPDPLSSGHLFPASHQQPAPVKDLGTGGSLSKPETVDLSKVGAVTVRNNSSPVPLASTSLTITKEDSDRPAPSPDS